MRASLWVSDSERLMSWSWHMQISINSLAPQLPLQFKSHQRNISALQPPRIFRTHSHTIHHFIANLWSIPVFTATAVNLSGNFSTFSAILCVIGNALTLCRVVIVIIISHCEWVLYWSYQDPSPKWKFTSRQWVCVGVCVASKRAELWKSQYNMTLNLIYILIVF